MYAPWSLLPGGGEEERVLHRHLVGRLEGEDPAAHEAADAARDLRAPERVLLDADVPGAPGGGDVEAHHHLPLQPRVPLQLALVAAADRAQPVADVAREGGPVDVRRVHLRSGRGDLARDLRVTLAGEGHLATTRGAHVADARGATRAATGTGTHRVRGGDAHPAGAGQRRRHVARAGAAAEHVRERTAAPGRAEDLEQPLAGHPLLEHGLALGGVLREVLLLHVLLDVLLLLDLCGL